MSYVSTVSDLQKSKMTREKTESENKKHPNPKLETSAHRKPLVHYVGREAK